MGLTGLFGPVDPRDAQRTIHHAIDLGIRHFDTAELYGPFTNETLLAEALSTKREATTVATKVGYRFVDGRRVGLDSRPASLRVAVEASLCRLGRERIDLVYQHRQDPDVPIEEAIGTLEAMRLEGKIGALGLSMVDRSDLARAVSVAAIAVVQNSYSLVSRSTPEGLGPEDTGGSAFVAYSPLARGILAGLAIAGEDRVAGDYRKVDPSFSAEQLAKTRKRLAPLWNIAATHSLMPATIALAWLLQRNQALATIPGCRTPAQVAVAVAATQVQLTNVEMIELDRVAC